MLALFRSACRRGGLRAKSTPVAVRIEANVMNASPWARDLRQSTTVATVAAPAAIQSPVGLRGRGPQFLPSKSRPIKTKRQRAIRKVPSLARRLCSGVAVHKTRRLGNHLQLPCHNCDTSRILVCQIGSLVSVAHLADDYLIPSARSLPRCEGVLATWQWRSGFDT